MAKRVFDLIFSFFGILFFMPLFLVLALLITLDSRGGIFYFQSRVGRFGKDFKLWKFRTMKPDSDKKGLLTVGSRDSRVTRIGYFLRKYKTDELPQLMNVFLGSMSFVGPRPEVRKYVNLYNEQQAQVLKLKPGITDYASIEYSNENELLSKAEEPEKFYIEVIMPTKLELNLKYVSEIGVLTDIKLILRTIRKIF